MEDFPSEIVGILCKQVKEMCLRQQQLQKDEDLLKSVIDKLNLHSCSVNYDGTTECADKEEIMKALQKAREDRDENKFQLNVCRSQIKELKEELGAARLNQTQHNISLTADLPHISERKSCAYSNKSAAGDKNNSGVELNRFHTVYDEPLERELKYLHKTNAEFLEKIRKLQSELVRQDQLLEKLKKYEEEKTNLRIVVEEKNAKIMDMQVKSDEQLKKCKFDFTYEISKMKKKILELEEERDAQKIALDRAYEEKRLLKLSPKKPEEEAAEHSSSIAFSDKAVTNSEPMLSVAEKETPVLLNVYKRRANRGKLQPIENIIVCQNSSFASLSEELLTKELQITVDEVKDLCPGVTKGTKRTQKGTKGSKKEPPVSQKKEAKKMKSSDERSVDTSRNAESELFDTNSSNTRKATRKGAAVNPKRKAKDCSKDDSTNKKLNKKVMAELETNENEEPHSFESSSTSFIGSSGKLKLTKHMSTPIKKPLKKVQDNVTKTSNRRRNK